jgi:hypothetical protein
MKPSQLSLDLKTCFEDPGAEKSGEYLYDHVATVARHALATGQREDLLNILQEWIARRSEPETMLAVDLVRELRLAELVRQLRELHAEIQAGKCFLPCYNEWTTRALAAIGEAPK